MKYKVQLFQDNTYEVVDEEYNSLFQGSLSDCEAWIRLTERDML